ncbi:helix-turn-helix domain-containing protein [Streptomyces sp. NPDC000594]|uniref:helix-turn-helix domain-containing protein n=1 Tax=Streptomyces sp. NPDC000594 TaxID=3154261 RepID=UPI00333030FC
MYRERISALAGAVVWEARTGAGHRVVPDGCMDLVWTPGRLLVAGPDTRAQEPGGHPPGTRFAGVRLAPGTAPALLGVAAHELRDRRVGWADLRGDAAARTLTGRLDTAADPAAELERLALELGAAAPRTPDPLLGAVVRALAAGSTVRAAADATGLGPRLLHRRSLHAFGYGPKTLARVLRFQRALGLIRAGTPLATAALAAGCADQAHLAREIRALGGTTPSAYAASAKRETPRPSGSSTTA